jgi:hypothetical protein
MASWQRQLGISGVTEGLPTDSQGLSFELSATSRRLPQSEEKSKGEEKVNRYTWKLRIR